MCNVVRDARADVDDKKRPGGPNAATVEEETALSENTESSPGLEVSLVNVYGIVLDKWIIQNRAHYLCQNPHTLLTNLVIYIFCVTKIKVGSFCSALLQRMRHG
jgi:hypothetical protein